MLSFTWFINMYEYGIYIVNLLSFTWFIQMMPRSQQWCRTWCLEQSGIKFEYPESSTPIRKYPHVMGCFVLYVFIWHPTWDWFSIYLSIYLPIYLYLYLSVSISIYPSFYLSLSLSLLSISIYLYFYLSLSICIYLYLSKTIFSWGNIYLKPPFKGNISFYIYLYLSISIYLI